MEGMEVWTQLLLLLLLLELPLSPPTMDLGLVSLLLFLLTSPSPTSRPLPLLAIGRVNDDVDERDNDDKDADAAGANPEAEGAQMRTRNAAGRFMILESAMWIMECLYYVFRFVDQTRGCDDDDEYNIDDWTMIDCIDVRERGGWAGCGCVVAWLGVDMLCSINESSTILPPNH